LVFMVGLYGHQLPAEPTEFSPMDSPENSSFDEMHRTLSVGRNVDTFQSITRTCAELAHGTGGSYAGGFAEVFTYRSFGSDAES